MGKEIFAKLSKKTKAHHENLISTGNRPL